MTMLSPVVDLMLAAATPPVANEAAANMQVHSIWDFVVKGGLMMIPIGICSLIGLAVLTERLVSLRRATVNGRPEPVDQRHSWDAPQWFTSYLMLNAPRHSDHHMHPGRIYPGLQIDAETMPMLPRSLPVMAVVALFPRWWRRVMNPAILKWQSQL